MPKFPQLGELQCPYKEEEVSTGRISGPWLAAVELFGETWEVFGQGDNFLISCTPPPRVSSLPVVKDYIVPKGTTLDSIQHILP